MMGVEMGIARIVLTEQQMHDIIDASRCENMRGERNLEWLRADLQRILGVQVVMMPRGDEEAA